MAKKSAQAPLKFNLLTFGFIAIIILLVGVFIGNKWSLKEEEKNDSTSQVSLLFVQTAPSGSLEADSAGGLALTLRNVSPSTVWFTNRPWRLSGQVPTTDFVATSWNAVGFQNDSPNGAIEAEFEDGSTHVITLDLSSPQYDETTKTLTYTVSILKGDPTEGLQHFHDRANREARGQFTNASLFIDDGNARWHDGLLQHLNMNK